MNHGQKPPGGRLIPFRNPRAPAPVLDIEEAIKRVLRDPVTMVMCEPSLLKDLDETMRIWVSKHSTKEPP